MELHAWWDVEIHEKLVRCTLAFKLAYAYQH